MGPRESYLRTWIHLRCAWFDNGVAASPLTAAKIYAVAALFKAGGYQAVPYYMPRAKEARVERG
eukprot:10657389-Alexandrium_andersonii.AAC.1